MKAGKSTYRLAGGLLALLVLCSCVFIRVTPKRMSLSGDYARVKASVRAHMTDGTVVFFDSGFTLAGNRLSGDGVRYDLARRNSSRIQAVPRESVALLERSEEHFNAGALLAWSSLPVAALGSLVFTGSLTSFFKAIFGCCPTIYTFDGSGYTLEAEAFSFNVTRLLSGRDLDRLDLGRLQDGEYRLMVTNEALETHYIDRLSLVAADHSPEYQAFPTDDGRVVLFGAATPLARAEDAAGRDVRAVLAERDSNWYRTDSARARRLADSTVHDWIDIAVPKPKGAKRMCLAVRGRNTLMSTVMFYDVLLKSQGVKSLDWQGMSRRDLPYALNLSKWHHRHFGMRVQTRAGKGFRNRVWLRDAGPIAWHEFAVELPATGDDTCRLRLDFLPDNWMLDWVGVSFDVPAPAQIQELRCAAVRAADGSADEGAGELLAANDGRYLVTRPGDCRYLSFRPGPVPDGCRRDYFVRSGGYYLEWLRPDWLQPGPVAWFQPDDRKLSELALRWQEKKPELERRFFAERVPVRREQ
jgi:hypothetical protein